MIKITLDTYPMFDTQSLRDELKDQKAKSRPNHKLIAALEREIARRGTSERPLTLEDWLK